MKCLDLTNFDKKLGTDEFSHLSRVDNVFIASRINEELSQNFIDENGITVAVDLKEPTENTFDEEALFSKLGVEYHAMPTCQLDSVDHDYLMKLKKIIDEAGGNILVYCGSGNRVTAVLTLMLYHICGHPKARVLEFSKKVSPEVFPLYEKVEASL